MARALFEIEGADDLIRKLSRMDRELSGKRLVDAVDAGAAVVEEATETLVPRRSGFLATQVGRENIPKRNPLVAETDVGYTKRAFYGRFQELGTLYHGAQPALRPAFDQTADDAADVILEELRKPLLRWVREGFDG